MNFNSDIDIDFPDRTQILSKIRHIPAGIIRDDRLVKHNTGVYFTPIPTDPMVGCASIDHKVAEERGYFKLDFLNVSLYNKVKSPQHLDELLSQEPPWNRLNDSTFFSQLIHIGNHMDTMKRMPEPIDSIPRLAMFLAIIRPAKRYLIGKTWKEVAKRIWEVEEDGYGYKASHAIAYAHLVVVNMNLINSTNESD
jgi:hypothetical protein